LDHGFLSHIIERVVCLGVEQNVGTHTIRPKVIMRDTLQTGLDASQYANASLVQPHPKI
jgi:hypothetical protein